MDARPRLPHEPRWFWLPEVLEETRRRGALRGDLWTTEDVLAHTLEVCPMGFHYGEQAARADIAAVVPAPRRRRPVAQVTSDRRQIVMFGKDGEGT